MNIAFLFLGIVPGLLAGLLAFVITYDEYSRHYVDRRGPLRLALEAVYESIAAGRLGIGVKHLSSSECLCIRNFMSEEKVKRKALGMY